MWTCLSYKEDRAMMEEYDEMFGYPEYDAYDPFEGEEETV